MSVTHLNTTLAILAGGEGSRMGRPKGLLTIAGRPILQHILSEARWPGPTLLVTARGREHPPGTALFDAEVVDSIAGQGPMRGVVTALEAAKTDLVVVSAVDMPSISSEVFGWLAQELDQRTDAHAVMIERNSEGSRIIEPLPAAFRKSARSLLEKRLESGNGSLRYLTVLPGINVLPAPQDWNPQVWTNLNFPRDLTG